MLNDIKFLKGTLATAEELDKIKPEIDKLYDQKKDIREKLNNFTE